MSPFDPQKFSPDAKAAARSEARPDPASFNPAWQRFEVEMAPVLGSFYRACQAQGFSQDQAFDLVRRVFDLVLAAAEKQIP
jgi:hypothetical protein